jgi:phosphoribosylanthranilate isomerase
MSAPGGFLVKICGITTPDDARLAIEAGADAIGVNLWSGSKRFVDEAAARAILAVVPANVLKVGVFVNASPAEVERLLGELGLDRAQLHGNEQAGAFERLASAKVVRAVRVRDEATFSSEAPWQPNLWLYDSHVEGYGGSGIQAPWKLIARLGQRPFLLAGGLTPDNVAEAIDTTRPQGVDVASGVESEPRRKDATRLRRFIEAARAAAGKL